MESVKKTLLHFIKENGLNIVSDGDWDGIVGSAILVKWCRKLGMNKYSIDLPHPRKVPLLTLSGNIVIELSPSRGYKVESRCILFDHHNFNGVAFLEKDNKIVPIIEYKEDIGSIAELIYHVLEIHDEKLEKLINIINYIDQGKSKEIKEAWRYHKAYLANIDSQGFRLKIFKLIIDEKYEELETIIQEAAKIYDKAQEYVEKIVARSTIIDDRIAVSWYNVDVKFEKIAFREAMFKLEEKYDLVIIAAKRSDNTIERLHLGSYKLDVGKIIEQTLNILKKEGVKGGGKRTAGGIQFPILTIRFDDLDKLINMFDQELNKLDTE